MHTHTYIHTCIHTYPTTHTYIHTYTQPVSQSDMQASITHRGIQHTEPYRHTSTYSDIQGHNMGGRQGWHTGTWQSVMHTCIHTGLPAYVQ